MKTKISIIIVNYNSGSFLKKCIDSIKKQRIKANVEIVVFDNNSHDNSLKIVKNEYKDVRVIENKRNLGFAEGNNRAVKVATGEYVFFLNPDTKLERNCLKILLDYAKKVKNKDFILVPKQVSYDEGKFLTLGLAVDIFGYPNTAYISDGKKQIRPIFYADGAAIFIPKHTFVKLGMFDGDMFMYQEDIDLCWKAHLMDIKLYPVADAVVFHKVGAVAGGGLISGKKYETNLFRRYLSERNLLRNLLKNYSFYNLIWILPLNFLINCLEITLFLILMKPRVSLIYLKAWLWNISNFKSVVKKRRWIQARRVVPDKAIFSKMSRIPSKLFLLARVGVPTVN